MADYVKYHADWKNRNEALTTPVPAEFLEYAEEGIFQAQRRGDDAYTLASTKINAADLAAHNSSTTAVHGIADTATLETQAGATAKANAVKARATHTGTQSADTLTDGTTNKAFLATERTKLTGVATGATANVTTDSLTDGTVTKRLTAANETKLSGLVQGIVPVLYDSGTGWPVRPTVPANTVCQWINNTNITAPTIGGSGAAAIDILLIVSS